MEGFAKIARSVLIPTALSENKRGQRYLNSEFGMRNAERKKRRQMTEVFEFGMRNAERKKRGQKSDNGNFE
jgi:hypothetical protein